MVENCAENFQKFSSKTDVVNMRASEGIMKPMNINYETCRFYEYNYKIGFTVCFHLFQYYVYHLTQEDLSSPKNHLLNFISRMILEEKSTALLLELHPP